MLCLYLPNLCSFPTNPAFFPRCKTFHFPGFFKMSIILKLLKKIEIFCNIIDMSGIRLSRKLHLNLMFNQKPMNYENIKAFCH